MSVDRTNGVAAHSKARGSRLAILFILANHENQQTYECFPSIDTIASEANLSRRAVQNALRALQRDGELTIIPGGFRDGHAYANQYQLNAPRLNGEQYAHALKNKGKDTKECRVQSATEDRVQSATDRVKSATDLGAVHYQQGEAHYTPSVQSATDDAYKPAPQPEEEPEREQESKPEKEPYEDPDPEYRQYVENCERWNNDERPKNSGQVEDAFTSLLEQGHSAGDLLAAFRGATDSGITDLAEILVADKIANYIANDPMLKLKKQKAAA